MYRPAGESDEDYSDFDEPTPHSNYYNYNHNYMDTPSLSSRLENAIQNGTLQELKEVVKDIDDVSKITLSNGWNAITFTANLGNDEALQFLTEKYPITELKDEFTPLMAVCNGPPSETEDPEKRLKCIQILLDAKIDINFKDRYGTNALMLASKFGRNDVVRYLLAHQANINDSDNDGWTALSFAVSNSHKETVSILLEHDADTGKVDKRNRTAYDIAFQKNLLHVADLIKPPTESNLDEQMPDLKPLEEHFDLLSTSEPKFQKDVVDILSATFMDKDNFYKKIATSGIDLRRFLLISSTSELRELGVMFSIHRRMLLQRIRQFHLYGWSRNSFGLKKYEGDSEKCSLVDVANFMATLYRQLYVLRTTLMYIKNDVRRSEENKNIVESLSTIRDDLISFKIRLASIKKMSHEINIKSCPLLFAQKLND